MHTTRLIFVLLLALSFFSCHTRSTLFQQIPSSQTGITFNNQIIEDDSVNVLEFENVYNGGGVGVADFNNDGLADIYFTGNVVPNKLYLNKGNFQFDDVTEKAGVSGNGRWCRGVAVVDINNDGLPDMYVCASVKKSAAQRENLLYVNQGSGKDGVPHFKEMAAEYGLNDTTHSTMAAFFDYDNDGDLDVYIAVNQLIKDDYANRFRPRFLNGEHPSTGRLYRNDWSDSLRHPVFTNVSRQAGILIEGYSHAVTITDINRDGWKDIYVTNDFLSNDILYINNHDGTFTDKVTRYFKHTSANAMGNDITDINNDGLCDVIELDMDPEDNYRKKMMLNANSYQTYQNSDFFKYQYQYVRNTLQLNRGPRVGSHDSIGDPIFSDIGFFAGIAETDWSWTPMVTDFDNDGFRDIIITNGFPKDITDHDFVAFRNSSLAIASREQLLQQIPQVKIHSYAYHNNGNLTFSDVTDAWGFETPSFSNGAAYADLDNDGDLDVVINHINHEASLYRNNLVTDKIDTTHFLELKLVGDSMNKNGLGTWIELHYQGQQQVYEQNPYRGYLSSVQLDPHFGLGRATVVDTVIVKWPNGKMQTLTQVKTNQTLAVKISDAQEHYTWATPGINRNALFSEITDSIGIRFKNEERDFIDFNIQKLLPHKFSEYGPALAAGDLDGNGLDDLIIGGSYEHSATLFLQQPNGRFVSKDLISQSGGNKKWEDAGIVLFDADGDGDLDIYIATGGYENQANTSAYKDNLYINDGKADFSIDSSSIPSPTISKSCVRAADFDHDGDLDLFVAGRVLPWEYPKPVSSFIFRNDSKDGKVKFTDVSGQVAPFLSGIGLVCDAVWTDFDNDGWQDLVLAGEWMPATFLKNNKGTFTNITGTTGVAGHTGWWNSIVPGDFDNDGDIDYVVGNLGLNSFYRASEKYPAHVYAKDFDNNGVFDAIPTLYLPASMDHPEKGEFPAQLRDDLIKQIIRFRAKYPNYKSYAASTFDKMLTPEELKGALVLQANDFAHALFRNIGGGKFEIIPLQATAQFSCLNGMIARDVDNDGNLDLVINGNDYGTEVSVGRYDACNGLVLRGDGNGHFSPLSILQSGIFIPGNGKALASLRNNKGQWLIAASQNRDSLKVFAGKANVRIIPVNSDDVAAMLSLPNGKTQRVELNYGASFYSQSARFITIGDVISACSIINATGVVRSVPLPQR